MHLVAEYLLYILSIVLLTYWIVIWIMHICAHANARLKLNKRSCTSAASKRKRKLEHLREKFLPCTYTRTTNDTNKKNHSCSLDINNNNNNNDNNNNNNNIRNHDTNNNGQQRKERIESFSNKHPLVNNNAKLPNNLDDSSNDCGCCKQHNHQQQQPLTSANCQYSYINLPLPGVSIIKPLVGVDSNLKLNLETFFNMDYPTYELLFCVRDPDDAAIGIVKNLLKTYPDVDAKLFIGGEEVGVNPKINNMQPAYEAIKYDLILISDSGISMRKDTLLDMVSHMSDDTALVHQMPFVCDGTHSFQSTVEKVYFGTAHARAYLAADLLSLNCATGMSALMRKRLLDEVGGIKAFGQYIAEDFFFAKSFLDRGWKLSICSQPAWQNAFDNSLISLNNRIQRWIKLRFAMVPQWTLLEPFSECMLLGILGAMSISFLWALNPLAIFAFHVLLWFLSDYKLLCTIQDGPLTFSKTDFIIAWLTRECTALYIFLQALSSPTVTWRTRSFKLRWGGLAEEVTQKDSNVAKSYLNESSPQMVQVVATMDANDEESKLHLTNKIMDSGDEFFVHDQSQQHVLLSSPPTPNCIGLNFNRQREPTSGTNGVISINGSLHYNNNGDCRKAANQLVTIGDQTLIEPQLLYGMDIFASDSMDKQSNKQNTEFVNALIT